MTYYLSSYGDSLAHHGVKGMKWGIRRWQNEDGSLTDEGAERYGKRKDRSGSTSFVRSVAKSSFVGRKSVSEWNADHLATKAAKARSKGNEIKAEKYDRKEESQRAANANRKAYEDHASTGKLVAQDLLLSKFGAQNYRAARARGEGRIRSVLETTAGVVPLATILAAVGNKKKYKSAIVLSDIEIE